MNRKARVRRFEMVDVYPVTCEALSEGRSNLEILEGVIQGGAKIVQLREKHGSAKDIYELALKFRETTAEADVLLIINDHLDIALAAEADGVHLGQEDLPISVARRLAPDLIIGASSHSLEEAIRAERAGADYVNIGPIFPTHTKQGASRFLGPEAIARISPHLRVPFTVMGGINASNIDEVLAQGARRVAMVTAITQAADVAETVKMLKKRINRIPTGNNGIEAA